MWRNQKTKLRGVQQLHTSTIGRCRAVAPLPPFGFANVPKRARFHAIIPLLRGTESQLFNPTFFFLTCIEDRQQD
ncbi:hypothetical protein Syun_024184 [Stephania yunnanensis]|uniref:Uncharacterized protein n=1 Tax=Stephania yunnanensis TaxID=152371 RepID=A0AAP0FQB5_9MAGN